MQIIELDDQDFPALHSHFMHSKVVGVVSQAGGVVNQVAVSNQFLMVASQDNPEMIAICPTRSKRESMELALEYLEEEVAEGHIVSKEPVPGDSY